MQPIHSSLTGKQGTYEYYREALAPDGFTLANWDYQNGYLDRQLDDKAMVFLRLPIEVRQGELDRPDSLIEFGTPFVLKHVYQTGVEENIGYSATPATAPLMNQFQEPINKDAPIESVWIEKAEAIVRELEQRFE
ncbi:YugN family protein [Brevibacillus sp. H7]|uniref:YugN family protein n=1 Tax=Brevibacillus sp. H7 TaxID=3349138 RepID=UPI0038101E74